MSYMLVYLVLQSVKIMLQCSEHLRTFLFGRVAISKRGTTTTSVQIFANFYFFSMSRANLIGCHT
jgi:hypothetical protein